MILYKVFLAVLVICCQVFGKEVPRPFSFHLYSSPPGFDPAQLSHQDASYLLHNLYRGLYSYTSRKGLIAEGAKTCAWKKLVLDCELNPNSKWSDGKTVVAEDYVRAFRHLLGPHTKATGFELIKNVRNASKVYSSKLSQDKLGIEAVDSSHLRFSFDRHDSDFLYKLANVTLVPIRSETFPDLEHANELLTNGPYTISKFDRGRKISLSSNEHFASGNRNRPPVEIYIIDDDQTALNLYEAKKLTFLRRLPSQLIQTYEKRPDFYQVPMARFDYVGFGKQLANNLQFKTALAHSLDYDQLKKLLHARGRPGCPGLPSTWFNGKHCVELDVPLAKKALEGSQVDTAEKPLKFAFSKLGGDDVKTQVEWMQAQWLKNLNLRLELQQTEQQVYLSQLRTNPPPLFRKGVSLDRPTCLAALETFSTAGSENFLKVAIPKLEKIIAALNETEDTEKRKQLCGEGIEILVDQFYLIPLGEIHFAVLASQEFNGWELNEMNQLDLSELARK